MRLYYHVGFEFNVYVNAQGDPNGKTRQNPLWHKPTAPPEMLREAIDELIQQVKSVDGLRCNMVALIQIKLPTKMESSE